MQALKQSAKPSKQRKILRQAPDHIRHKLLAAPLSPELKAEYGVNAIPVRSGDTVRVMRGDHKGFEGKITRVDRKKFRIYVEGLTREKVDGSTIFVPVHPSKVMITRLNLDDKWRKGVLERKKVARKELEKAVEVKGGIVEEKLVEEEKSREREIETAKELVEKEAKTEKVEEREVKTKTKKKQKIAQKKEGKE
ncbi:MAG: 50S ribosomal protein L24 [Candidatus Bathyarchaeia archaeon]